jgi:cystathionine beta-lyase family protein involved in aluminum resistance
MIDKEEIELLIRDAEDLLKQTWQNFDEIKNHNQIKVLKAFQKAGIQNSHFSWVTGYGYDDLGKDKLDEVFSAYFNTEAAFVRPHLVSGTHAIVTAIFGNLEAGDEIVSVTGKPYDTLCTAFTKLCKKYKIKYSEGINKLNSRSKLAFIQRSRGYEWRESLSINEIERLVKDIKSVNPETIVFVDNCYGEFTQKLEPTDVGADLIAGSLIKNPGGGIVSAGAYIAGKKNLVNNATEYLTAPGIAHHGGCMFDQTRLYFQGFFMAALIVSEALKGMSLAAKVLVDLGYETIPAYDSDRNDIIQAIKFGTKEKLIEFCALLQKNSPINSMFSPVPDSISGYDDQVIMAAGTFIEGSSIELSADAPLREPYVGYLQGGLSCAHTRYFLSKLLQESI